MPRKSKNELATRVTDISVRRPAAPIDLTEFERSIWDRVVGSLPADWFRPLHFDLLVSYCRHTATAATLAGEIERWKPEWLREEGGVQQFNRILVARERETAAMARIATKLRLTHQSIDKKVAAGKLLREPSASATRPWDFGK